MLIRSNEMKDHSTARPHHIAPFSAFAFAIVCSLASQASADWPQWRGPNRDGHALESSAPKSWPSRLTERWSVFVGIGHSSPIVANGQVFQFSRQNGKEVVRRLDLANGKSIWKSDYAAPYTAPPVAGKHGDGPKSTPVVANGRLFTFGITGILTGWNVETGERLWQEDFKSEFQNLPSVGTAASPIVYNDSVIIHLGGYKHGALRAFNTRTGEAQWSYGADGPSFASPVIATFGKSVQLITLTESAVVAVSPDSGMLLWRIPFGNEEQNIVTPVVHGGIVILSGAGDGLTCAVRPTETKGKWLTKELWRNRKIFSYMSTPVAAKERLVGLAHRRKGQLTCSSIDTNEILWVSSPRLSENAALIVAGNAVLIQLTTGRILVIDPTADELKTIAEYTVSKTETWAHPALTDGFLLTKDYDTIRCWALKD